jgi:hypothetical protein
MSIGRGLSRGRNICPGEIHGEGGDAAPTRRRRSRANKHKGGTPKWESGLRQEVGSAGIISLRAIFQTHGRAHDLQMTGK